MKWDLVLVRSQWTVDFESCEKEIFTGLYAVLWKTKHTVGKQSIWGVCAHMLHSFLTDVMVFIIAKCFHFGLFNSSTADPTRFSCFSAYIIITVAVFTISCNFAAPSQPTRTLQDLVHPLSQRDMIADAAQVSPPTPPRAEEAISPD